MLNTCEQYSTDFNIIFNASKTKLMVFGRHASKVDVFQVRVASKVNNEAHVGNISTDIYNDEMSISKACNEMYAKLEALRECRPPWPRQIITLILPTVKMLSLGCERLLTP